MRVAIAAIIIVWASLGFAWWWLRKIRHRPDGMLLAGLVFGPLMFWGWLGHSLSRLILVILEGRKIQWRYRYCASGVWLGRGKTDD